MEIPQWAIVKDGVLFLIAVYGAALSTFNWRQAVKKDKRQITVSISTVMPSYGNRLGNAYAKVEAINTGQRVVTIKTISIELPTGARLFAMAAGGIPAIPDTPLPISLSDGQTAFLMMAYEEIGNALLESGRSTKTELKPVCVDTADNVYHGKPWQVDPHELIRMSG
jgi:hypothetical protein